MQGEDSWGPGWVMNSLSRVSPRNLKIITYENGISFIHIEGKTRLFLTHIKGVNLHNLPVYEVKL